jgi:hypothetical protein
MAAHVPGPVANLVAWATPLRHIIHILQIPRGREAPVARQGVRRRRNRPPETLRQKGRAGKGPLERSRSERGAAPKE